ncbi:MAG: recombinase family protein [Synergistaceae bacterium]|jgi:DNA invertase Pin-like site-specific DNA recombinase|nr:recombinase family protein [Synergistaceae bacterium]
MNPTNKITYFLYARKSSESEDRQIQSIDDQINKLKEVADRLNLSIKKTYTEAKSAKKPNNRPLFDEMLKRIEAGEANGILCWQMNRLSRNPVDSGKLGWLLQQGVIKSIQTPDRTYLPDDNVILFNVETGSANQYILDLSKAVKRGINSKLAKGWRPGSAPQGYLNSKIKDRGDNDLLIDPDRFSLVRKMWDLMLTGNYMPSKILEIANNQWGYRTRKTKRKGGLPLSRSGIYKIFTNPFYAGIFYWGKEKIQYDGKHQKMITLDEYDRVQKLLGRDGKPRPKTHHFAFTGSLHCAECGCLFTALEKEKLIKSTGKIKKYTYYYCTRKKKDIKCTQKKVLTEENLEIQIEKEIEKYTILPEFLNWALQILNEHNDREIEDRSKIYEMQNKGLLQTQKELDNLTQMRYRELIDDEIFLKSKKELQSKITLLKEKLNETEARAEKWLELTEKTFNFVTYARKKFLAGGLEPRKEILMALGKTPMIREGKLVITPFDWLEPIKNGYPALEEAYLRLEPTKIGKNTHKKEVLSSIFVQWRSLWNEIRTWFINRFPLIETSI